MFITKATQWNNSWLHNRILTLALLFSFVIHIFQPIRQRIISSNKVHEGFDFTYLLICSNSKFQYSAVLKIKTFSFSNIVFLWNFDLNLHSHILYIIQFKIQNPQFQNQGHQRSISIVSNWVQNTPKDLYIHSTIRFSFHLLKPSLLNTKPVYQDSYVTIKFKYQNSNGNYRKTF